MLQELLHPSRVVVFPVVLHVALHVVLQELLHPSRFVVFPVVLHVVLQELLHPSRFVVFPVVLHVVLQESYSWVLVALAFPLLSVTNRTPGSWWFFLAHSYL